MTQPKRCLAKTFFWPKNWSGRRQPWKPRTDFDVGNVVELIAVLLIPFNVMTVYTFIISLNIYD